MQPNPGSGAGCSSPEQFIYIPEMAAIPGPDTSNTVNQCNGASTCILPQTCCQHKAGTIECVSDSSKCLADGDVVLTNSTATSGDVAISCSVIPSGGGYNVTLQGKITGGTAPGTLTVTGTFTPRTRDSSGKSSVTGDATKIPNIHVSMLDATKHLDETDCFAQYTSPTTGNPACRSPIPPTLRGRQRRSHLGQRLLPDADEQDESQKPGNAGCEMSTTFRFENCASKAP